MVSRLMRPLSFWLTGHLDRFREFSGVAMTSAVAHRTTQRLVQLGHWDRIVDGTSDRRFWIEQPRLMQFRLIAARQTERVAELVPDVVTAARSPDLVIQMRFVIVRELLKSERPAEAWAVLNADPAAWRDPLYLKVAGRIRAATKDPALRDAIQEATGAAAPGQRVARKPSSFAYAVPSPETVESGHTARFDLYHANRVSQRHVDRIQALEEDCRTHFLSPTPPSLFEYADVFVDGTGQIWSPDGTVIKTTGHAMEVRDPTKVPTIETAFSMAGATKGLYHWLVDRTPQLALFLENEGCADITLLMSPGAPAFERATLDLLGIDESRWRPVPGVVFCKRLIVPVFGFRGLRAYPGRDPVSEHLVQRSRALCAAEEMPAKGRIYISRRDAHRRAISNEDEVEAAMVARGIEPVQFSGLQLHQQIFLSSQADLIVGPHGAGLSHILLAKPGVKVVEAMPVTDGAYNLRFNYARLCMVKNIDYRAWIDEPPPAGPGWAIDVEGFASVVDHALDELSGG